MKPSKPRSSLPEPSADTPQWLKMLQKSNKQLRQKPLAQWMSEPGRFEHFSCRHDGILFDYSRAHLDPHGIEQLLAVARERGLPAARDRLFAGEAVNVTERRPAMHMALRCPELLSAVPREDADRVRDTQAMLHAFAADLHRGRLPANGRAKVTDIIHVGIGGSLLGPRLVCEALPPGGADTPRIHFLGSVDAYPRERLLPRLQAESTVVILASKSFSTPDTLMHGQHLRNWLRTELGDQGAGERLFAVTAAAERARKFGLQQDQILFLPEWVGGRYSLWSAVSLVAAAHSGPQAFEDMLDGAADMDRHFAAAELRQNLPVMLGLLGVWHRNVCGYPAWGVIPYDQRLRLLPAHLQQLIMESNGKATTLDGSPVPVETSPLVFGEPGTEAQHSLFQALHQGTDITPLHFVGVIRPAHSDREAHDELLANMLAQATALATGRSAEQTRAQFGDAGGAEEGLLAHRTFAGNRPSELLILDELDARRLGALLALYEHKVFVESVIWDINAFDQWGVELGKTLAPGIRGALSTGDSPEPSLAGVLDYIRGRRDRDSG